VNASLVLLWLWPFGVANLPTQSATLPDTTAAVVLLQLTQRLLHGAAIGDATPWRQYLHERVVFTDENGTELDRADLIAQLGSLPPGVSGTIEPMRFVAEVFGNVAVTAYLIDEHEHFHGQELHDQYRETDTWIRDGADWKMIAAQVLALQQDPPSVQLADQVLDSYVGLYSAAPDYLYSITRDSAGLEGRVNNGTPQRLLAEMQDVLFVPGLPRARKIFRRNPTGEITGFVSRREGRDVAFVRRKSR
jgi:hypothetical protein